MALQFLITALLTLLSTALAQNPYSNNGGSSGNPYANGGSNSGNPYATGGSSSGNPYTSGGSSGNPYAGSYHTLDYEKLTKVRLAHAVLASAAFVFFFPVGAITIRVIPSRYTLWLHAACQVFAYALYTIAFGLGVWMASQIQFGSFKLIATYHPIIGIIVFALCFFQPILGLLHHFMFKKYKRRTVWSYGHIWLGRIVITLGIINGGLGLRLANNTKKGELAYAIIAGVMWLLWMASAVYGEVKRARKLRSTAEQGKSWDKEPASGDDSSGPVTQERKLESFRYE